MDQLWFWPIVTTVFFISAAIVVIFVRRRRFSALLPRAAALVPPSNSVVWRLNGPAFEPAEALSRQQLQTAGGAIIAAAPLITTSDLLNPDVMGALEQQDHDEAFCDTYLADYLNGQHDGRFSVSYDPGFIAALDDFSEVMHASQAVDVGVSLKTGAIDAAGVLGGGFIGMSLGQLLGRALLDSTGTTAAAALLSIGGAILGRMMSDRVKRKSFRIALETFDAARVRALERIEHQRQVERMAIKRFVEDRDKALREAINEERRKILAAVRDGRNSADNERQLACRTFVSHLDEVQQRIWKGFYEFRETHQSSIVTRWLYPKEGDVAVELARRWAQDASNRVEQLHTFLWTLVSSPDEHKRTEAGRVITEFIRLFDCNAERYYAKIKVHAERVAELQQGIEDQAKTLDGRFKRLIVEAQRDVQLFIDDTRVRLDERLAEIEKPVFEALDRVRSEGRKFG